MDSTTDIKTSIIIGILVGMIVANAISFKNVSDELNHIKSDVSDIHEFVTIEEETIEYVGGDLCE